MNGLMPLNAEALAEVQANARTRGIYKTVAEAFLASDEQGAQVSLSEGPFANKVPNTVKQGFNNVAKTHNLAITVHEIDEDIFLIRKSA